MKKKFLSFLCVFALVFSTIASFTLVEAAPNVTYKLEFNDTGEKLSKTYDSGYKYYKLWNKAPVYKATLTVQGASEQTPIFSGEDIVGFTGALMKGLQAAIRYESSKSLVMISSTPLAGGSSGTDINDSKVLTMSWSTSATSAYLTKDTLACTWYLFAEDGTEITDMKLYKDANSLQKVEFAEVYEGTMEPKKLVSVTDINFINYPAAPTTYTITTPETITGGSIEVQKTAAAKDTVTIKTTPDANYEVSDVKVTGDTAGSVDVETVTANAEYKFIMPAENVKIDVKFAKKADDGTADRVSDSKGENHWKDGDNDHSVAFSKTFTNTEAKTYTLEAVVDGKTYTHPKEIEIPNVDENVEYKVGIIIQYNPNAAEGIDRKSVV